MKKTSLYGIVIGALSLAVGFFGCKKTDGVDNNQVLQTPYALFFADSAGALYKTNDGTNYKFLFPADGKACRAIFTSGPNLLWVKDRVYISQDNGKNFNPTYDLPSMAMLPSCGTDSLPLNQTMVIDVEDWSSAEVLALVASRDPNLVASGTLFIDVGSKVAHGLPGTWYAQRGDTVSPTNTVARVGSFPFYMTSFTEMPNKCVVGYDALQNRFAYRNDASYWIESTGNDAGNAGVGDPTRQSGTGLPDNAYCIGHFNQQIIALINKCPYHGAWYSNDTGRNFKAYSGLPSNALLCIASPFENVCLVGTQGAGLYTLNLNTGSFQPNRNGLGSDLIVRSIASHQNIYKNGNTEKFIFLATNKGIYMSKDGGLNWTKTIPGNYTAVY